ncbi:hypothetical protein HPB52_022824 [Rhipicephalus sanguineus]|uniref:Uncharacterized protein n=1 Tax=Rhipicephalus sanguineus TaxID=34632 RepID=A0A9D4PHH2_RHISA|nr:hypothetical protein HPB52_022824 [Rhipicephalus sanguineus]
MNRPMGATVGKFTKMAGIFNPENDDDMEEITRMLESSDIECSSDDDDPDWELPERHVAAADDEDEQSQEDLDDAASTNVQPAACATQSAPPGKYIWKEEPFEAKSLPYFEYDLIHKPRVPCELRTFLPGHRVGDAIRAYLGDQTTAQVQVWPIWEQNIIVCSTTMQPKAQKLLGDFQLPVGHQQLPVRGHTKPSGETSRGVITINHAETSEKIK